jgi:proline dehydrogenase
MKELAPSQMVDVNNTAIAFESKSGKELSGSIRLFKLMNSKPLVEVGTMLARLGMALHLPIKGIIKNTIYKQFVGGESIDECRPVVTKLWQYHVGTILDYSVEGAKTEAEFDAAANELISTIRFADNNPAVAFSVFKVTGVMLHSLLEKKSSGSAFTENEAEAWRKGSLRVEKICDTAAGANVRVFIDAEESWIQPAIDELANAMMRKHNKRSAVVYNTIQLYRHDRLSYLKDMFATAKMEGWHYGVKLVRGAYMEKERARALKMGYPSPIQPNKKETDIHFDEAVQFCLNNIETIGLCAGSHNEASCLKMVAHMQLLGLAPDDSRCYFSQLLGMSDNLSFNLADAGYRVAKYVPYGPVHAVFPYLTRRASENSSIAGQMSRELRLLVSEAKRRRNLPTTKK